MVIKRVVPEGRREFVYAVNFSEQSKRGLDVLLRVINPRDSLTLVHFSDPEAEDNEYIGEMVSYYERELDSYGPARADVKVIEKERGVAITATIADYVNAGNYDFFAIAPRAKIVISSITTYIVNRVDCNVILCKA
jgi:hypothetical protein